MHRFLPLLAFVFLFGCRQPQALPAPTAHDSIFYPYSPVYGNDYRPGRDSLAFGVLRFWKELESGDVLHTADLFADSVVLIFPDTIVRADRTAALTAFRRRRAAYTDLQCYVDSWTAQRENTRNEQLVFLWGRQDGTTPRGRRDYRVLHEIWRFDAAGHIRELDQYMTHPY